MRAVAERSVGAAAPGEHRPAGSDGERVAVSRSDAHNAVGRSRDRGQWSGLPPRRAQGAHLSLSGRRSRDPAQQHLLRSLQGEVEGEVVYRAPSKSPVRRPAPGVHLPGVVQSQRVMCAGSHTRHLQAAQGLHQHRCRRQHDRRQRWLSISFSRKRKHPQLATPVVAPGEHLALAGHSQHVPFSARYLPHRHRTRNRSR